jgi:hypothetical protein
VLAALRTAYGINAEIPDNHLFYLGQQLETQRAQYDEEFEEIDIAVALIKASGFDRGEKDGKQIYTARISFSKENQKYYQTAMDTPDSVYALENSFHYDGYNFDSAQEIEFLEWVLTLLKNEVHQIEGIWFTGGFTDANKTDLLAEYLGEDGRWHHYTPDFVLRRIDGKHLIVEIKADRFSLDINADLDRLSKGETAQTQEGRKAVALKRWETLNPDKLTYHVMFSDNQLKLKDDGKQQVRDFIRGM